MDTTSELNDREEKVEEYDHKCLARNNDLLRLPLSSWGLAKVPSLREFEKLARAHLKNLSIIHIIPHRAHARLSSVTFDIDSECARAIKLIQTISSALSGLVGAVLGYYYGTSGQEKSTTSNAGKKVGT